MQQLEASHSIQEGTQKRIESTCYTLETHLQFFTHQVQCN